MTDPLVSRDGAAALLDDAPAAAKARLYSTKNRLEPETMIGGRPVWRTSTLQRWAACGYPPHLPISPRLEIVGVQDLCERWQCSIALIRKLRLNRQMTEPEHVIPDVLIAWDLATVQAMDPICTGCRLPVQAVRSERCGRRVCLICECGASTPLIPR
jgi:hypothetical protein